jgi:Fur family ferric uptake transcriptional regulator
LNEARTVEETVTMLRQRGTRITSARRVLLGALFDGPAHRTAEQLAAEVQKHATAVSLSTIYRNLDELERHGVVVHSHLGHRAATYDLAASAQGHLVCEACGAVIEVPNEVFRSLRYSLEADFGFAADPRHLAIAGRCADCQTPPPPAAPPDLMEV